MTIAVKSYIKPLEEEKPPFKLELYSPVTKTEP
jgi:hypothetical protein